MWPNPQETVHFLCSDIWNKNVLCRLNSLLNSIFIFFIGIKSLLKQNVLRAKNLEYSAMTYKKVKN